jgi:hypothetical protein
MFDVTILGQVAALFSSNSNTFTKKTAFQREGKNGLYKMDFLMGLGNSNEHRQ